MSLITDFPFKAFMADLKTRHTVDHKTGISLSLLTSEDMEVMSAVEVRTPCREENSAAPWEVVMKQGEYHATFYDTRMGNFQVKGFPTKSCSTCGNGPSDNRNRSANTMSGRGGVEEEGGGAGRSAGVSSSGASAITATPPPSASSSSSKNGNERCTGHFGFVSMPRKYPLDPARRQERLHVLNPHLFNETLALLRSECYFCHHFRASLFDTERFRLALVLADAGLPGEARQFVEVVQNYRRQGKYAKSSLDSGVSSSSSSSAVLRERIGQLSSIEDMRQVVQRILDQHRIEVRGGVCSSALVAAAEGGAGAGGVGSSPSLRHNQSSRHRSDAHASSSRLASFDVRSALCHEALAELQKYSLECAHCGGISPSIRVHNGHLFFHFREKDLKENISNGILSTTKVKLWKALNTLHERRYNAMHTDEVRQHIKSLCQHEGDLLGMLFQKMGEATVSFPFDTSLPPQMLYKVFFLDKVLVPPLPVRLASGVQVDTGGRIVPDDCTRRLSQIVKCVDQIERYFMLRSDVRGGGTKGAEDPPEEEEEENEKKQSNHHNTRTVSKTNKRGAGRSHGPSTEQERIHERNLQDLQTQVTELYHTMLDSFAKKDGLYRMNMMGKRVNQACRSVISPDYLVEPNELLLPRPFARRLTFPEQVSMYAPARAALLQRCVRNGPHVYPGATHLEWRLSTGEVTFVDLNGSEAQRRQHAYRYFAMAQSSVGNTLIVHRHILDGDRLIFNRQPTLHKVSMMGYRARVLSGLKTLRFHYINSKSYNADFDGDEMNVHIPQSLEAKAELDCLMDADLHYLIPTSGKPIRGLIQDHLVAAVLLTLRDKFFDRETFMQLVFIGLFPYLQQQLQQQQQPFSPAALPAGTAVHHPHLQGGGGGTFSPSQYTTIAALIPIPAIVWPTALWTGKQLVSVVIRFVTGVMMAGPPTSPGEDISRSSSSTTTAMSKMAALPAKASNDGLHVRAVSLIQPSVYTHTNLRDPSLPLVKPSSSSTSGGTTTSISQMAEEGTVLLSHSTLLTGVLDKNQLGPTFLSIPHLVHEGYGAAMVGRLFAALGRLLTATLQAEGFSMGLDDMLLVKEDRRSTLLEELDLAPLRMRAMKMKNRKAKAEEEEKSGPSAAGATPVVAPAEEEVEEEEEAKVLPHIMKLATEIQKEFVPGRLLVPFPKNQLIMMTASGAKGSNTNAIQMALGLGQQLFDGRRVSRMNSGKTLPAFFIKDPRARSFGYAMGRFVSGIRPGEYTIHAMAGRDGLIDTAVKTSRSGHLQRCLIKGLEGLVAHWDGSVRDTTSSEVFQFKYGGDGLDPVKASTLHQWEVLMRNAEDLGKRFGMDAVLGGGGGANHILCPPRGSAAGGGAGGGVGEEGMAKKRRRDGEGGIKTEEGEGEGEESHPKSMASTNSIGEKRHRLDEALLALLKEKRAALFRHAYQMQAGDDGMGGDEDEAKGENGSPSSSAHIPKHLARSLRQYLEKQSTQFPLFKKPYQIERWLQKSGAKVPSPAAWEYVKRRLDEKRQATQAYYEDVMTEITMYKRGRCLCDAGEPVGLLAAQAAGEPSTQMTLNTFHSAGSTVTHVTEGIPRLRELLLYASVKKSAVVVPVENATPEEEEKIRKILRASPVMLLADCLARVSVSSRQDHHRNSSRTTERQQQKEEEEGAAAAARGYHYCVIPPSMDSSATSYVISLLFSYAALEDARVCACMSREEHVSYFCLALREFAKQVVALLSGGGSRGGGGEKDSDEEDNFPPHRHGEDEDNEDDRGGVVVAAEAEEEEEQNKGNRGNSGRGKRKKDRRVRKGRSDDDDDEDDEDDDDEEEEDVEPRGGRRKHRVSFLRDGEDKDEEDEEEEDEEEDEDRGADSSREEDEEEDDEDEGRRKRRRTEQEKKSTPLKRRRLEDDDDEEEEQEEEERKGKEKHRQKGWGGETAGTPSAAASNSSIPNPSSSKASSAANHNHNTSLCYSDPRYVQDSFMLRSERFLVSIRPRVGGRRKTMAKSSCSHHDATLEEEEEDGEEEEMPSSLYGGGRRRGSFPLPPLPSDFFVVEIVIEAKEKPHVVVLPDVLDRVLGTLEFPSWLPRFDSVTFTRKSDDVHSGELVFQGGQATLENVLRFLSVFLVDTDEPRPASSSSSSSSASLDDNRKGGEERAREEGIKLHKARSTNIHHMIRMLGVESGYKTLLDELTSLFKRYAVDYHHLTLIADAATHRGDWDNFNFTGIVSHSASPLFQMTVASSKKFLHTAITHGVGDELNSFSASIMVGEKPKVGTACAKVVLNPVLLPDIFERQFTL